MDGCNRRYYARLEGGTAHSCCHSLPTPHRTKRSLRWPDHDGMKSPPLITQRPTVPS